VSPRSGPSSTSSLRVSRLVVASVCVVLIAIAVVVTVRFGGTDDSPSSTIRPTTTRSASSAPPSPVQSSALAVPPTTVSGGTGALGGPTATPPSSTTSATPATSATAATSSRSLDLAAVAEDRLDQGLIAYNPPQTATHGEEFQVTVRLQRGVSVTSTALPKVPGPGTPTIETLPVGAYMTAALDGPGFTVRPITPSRLPLAPDEIAEFSWVVAPKAVGALTLTLTLVAEVQGQPARERSYSRQITVTVLPDPSAWSRLVTWSGWTDVASGVMVAGLVALVTWLLARMRRRRREGDTAERPMPVEPPAPAAPPKEGVISGEEKPKGSSEAASSDGRGSAPRP
jgi:hypothetical protein